MTTTLGDDRPESAPSRGQRRRGFFDGTRMLQHLAWGMLGLFCWAAPALASPGAFQILSPLPGPGVAYVYTNDTQPTVTWSPSAGAGYYQVALSTGTHCANPSFVSGQLTTTALQLPQLAQGLYWVCVTAYGGGSSVTATPTDYVIAVDLAPPPPFTLAVSPNPVTASSTPLATLTANGTNTFGDPTFNYTVTLAYDSACTQSAATASTSSGASTVPVSFAPTANGSYYACATSTDTAGNVTHASNDGVPVTVYYTTPPEAFFFYGGGAEAINSGGGEIPIVVLAPPATFQAIVQFTNLGNADTVNASYSIRNSSGTVILPSTAGTPKAVAHLGIAAWTFNDANSLSAALPHDAYTVEACVQASSGQTCSDIQVNLTTDPGPLDADTLTFDQLRDLALFRRSGSIDGLIPLLPAEYLSDNNYTLMNVSRSLQAATPTKPRVIMPGPTAKFIIAYNAANALEMIQFRDATQSFEFRSVDFDNGAHISITPPNPSLCQGCHGGADPRPNWEAYPFWPGAFGGDDDVDGTAADFFGSGVSDGVYEYCVNNPSDPKCSTDEAESYQSFVSSADHATNPRYNVLGDLLFAGDIGGGSGPNHLVTTRIAKLNFQRLARILCGSADPTQCGDTYYHSKFLLALLLSHCDEGATFDNESGGTVAKSTFLPPDPWAQNLVPDGYTLGMRCTQEPSLSLDHCGWQTPFQNLGYQTRYWPTSFFPDSNPGFGLPALNLDPAAALLYWMVVRDPELQPYFTLNTAFCTQTAGSAYALSHESCLASLAVPCGGTAHTTCQNLATKSYQRLSAWTNHPPF